MMSKPNKSVDLVLEVEIMAESSLKLSFFSPLWQCARIHHIKWKSLDTPALSYLLKFTFEIRYLYPKKSLGVSNPLVLYESAKHELMLTCLPGGAEKGALRLRSVPALGGSPPCQSPALWEAHLQQPNRRVPQEAAKGWRGNVHICLACSFVSFLSLILMEWKLNRTEIRNKAEGCICYFGHLLI